MTGNVAISPAFDQKVFSFFCTQVQEYGLNTEFIYAFCGTEIRIRVNSLLNILFGYCRRQLQPTLDYEQVFIILNMIFKLLRNILFVDDASTSVFVVSH